MVWPEVVPEGFKEKKNFGKKYLDLKKIGLTFPGKDDCKYFFLNPQEILGSSSGQPGGKEGGKGGEGGDRGGPDDKLISIRNLDNSHPTGFRNLNGSEDVREAAKENYGSLVEYKLGIKEFVFGNFQEGQEFWGEGNDCLKLLMQNYKLANANFERSLDRVMKGAKGAYSGNGKNLVFDGFQEKGVNE